MLAEWPSKCEALSSNPSTAKKKDSKPDLSLSVSLSLSHTHTHKHTNPMEDITRK
jgi:hypothetical protein